MPNVNSELSAAHAEYERLNPHYDELFTWVQERVSSQGAAGKPELAALAFWKRLNCNTRWVEQLLSKTEAEVSALTRGAVEAAREPGSDPLGALDRLPGVGGTYAFASALLCAIDADHWPVYDRRAGRAIQTLLGRPLTSHGAGRYREYVELVRSLRDDHPELRTARDIDKALFIIGRDAAPT